MAEAELLQCLREILPGMVNSDAWMAPEPVIAVLAVPWEASNDDWRRRFQLTRCIRERPDAGVHGVGFPRDGRAPAPEGCGQRRAS